MLTSNETSEKIQRLQNVCDALRGVARSIERMQVFYAALPTAEASIIERVASLDIDALVASQMGLRRTIDRVQDEVFAEDVAEKTAGEDDIDVTETP
jgi:hypothetical protein